MNKNNNLIISSSPHFKEKISTQKIMLDVIIALLPSIIASIIIFGFRAILIISISIITCVASEYISRYVMKRKQTINDLSAIVTGILFAFNLPVTINPLIVVLGGVIAIVVVKQMFGGIGQNFVNPALTARIILMSSFPSQMSTWVKPFYYKFSNFSADIITSATPLGIIQNNNQISLPNYKNLFLGINGGCLGETSVLAIIIGGIYLIHRKIINIYVPLYFLATIAIIALLSNRDIILELLTGGAMLGAFFMITDYTTIPYSTKGRIIFAIGCAIITMLIRIFGSLPEGVSFSILIMNILVPHIEKLVKPKIFGNNKTKECEE